MSAGTGKPNNNLIIPLSWLYKTKLAQGVWNYYDILIISNKFFSQLWRTDSHNRTIWQYPLYMLSGFKEIIIHRVTAWQTQQPIINIKDNGFLGFDNNFHQIHIALIYKPSLYNKCVHGLNKMGI